MSRLSDAPSEEDARLRYITPAIQNAGWGNDSILTERTIIDDGPSPNTITDGRVVVSGNRFVRRKGLQPDYVLCDKPDHYIAVVEAKRSFKTSFDGIQQAINYAQMLDAPFAYSSNGENFLEQDLLTGSIKEISLGEFPSPEELVRRLREKRPLRPGAEEIVNTPYYFEHDRKPRYYQCIAINRTVEAIANGQQRILLVMATGTGKTYTAFQIIHRLHKSGAKKKILYLADRNILIDQTMNKDFRPFAKVMTKVKNAEIDPAYEIYMALYHQLVGDEEKGEPDPFRKVKSTFFDLIIVDECHRGSVRDDSAWRRILEYFNSATQIGMTATPKAEEGANNLDYFGEPIYTYSLKQGIEDGFLAPYRVTRVELDIDQEGYTPESGELDKKGKKLEKAHYTQKDIGKFIRIEKRQELVAEEITKMLYKIDSEGMTKTIVFCSDTDDAAEMCILLKGKNEKNCRKDPRYVMRITGNDNIGKAQLENFIDDNQMYPTVVTTSELLSTGVDCKTCGLIVIDKEINSMTEFKQIIGRGTRLVTEKGKWHLEILDFRGATEKFKDPEFDGNGLPPEDPPSDKSRGSKGGNGGGTRADKWEKHIVEGREYTINNETVLLYDAKGNICQEVSVAEFAKKQILKIYPTLENFRVRWNEVERKRTIISDLKEYSIIIDAIVDQNDTLAQADIFDVICNVAYGQEPLTRQDRADKVKNSNFLGKYDGRARDVLEALLENYVNFGILNIEDPSVLRTYPFIEMGMPSRIERLFENTGGFAQALVKLEQELYK